MKNNWYKKAQSAEKPWTMTKKEFVDYHNTGFISSSAYEKYQTVDGMSWLGPKSIYPILHSVKQFGDKKIEFRMSGEKLNYVALDDNGEIIYDKKHLAVMLTDEQIASEGRHAHSTTIVAFDGESPIGFASDEFGSDGVWIVNDYQKKGIGTYLLNEFRKQFKPTRKIGQMTSAGFALTESLHKQYVIQALEKGLEVPERVLSDYPDLKRKEL